MAALLADIKPGDEVIMPSYTFVSTADAFVLRGATAVFVDIRPDTMNIDETLIEDAITDMTRAIVPVACVQEVVRRAFAVPVLSSIHLLHFLVNSPSPLIL